MVCAREIHHRSPLNCILTLYRRPNVESNLAFFLMAEALFFFGFAEARGNLECGADAVLEGVCALFEISLVRFVLGECDVWEVYGWSGVIF